jgi:NADH-quinone oxidoreductase subunit G
LVRSLGSENIDFRLRMQDFSLDAQRTGAPWLGMPVAGISSLDRILIVGSFLRKEQPILAARIRQAVKRGTKVSVIHSVDEDLLMPLIAKAIARPSMLPWVLAEVVVAAAAQKSMQIPAEFVSIQPSEPAQLIAKSLISGKHGAVLLGPYVLNHPHASTLYAAAQWLSEHFGLQLGVLPEQSNSTGAYLLKAFNPQGAVAAKAGNILLNLEPALDADDGAALTSSLQAASSVIALTAYKSAVEDCATVMLPIAPFTETAGSLVNMGGDVQSFVAAVKPAGEARPAWKVLRMLGQELGLSEFTFNSFEEVQQAALQQINSLPEAVSNQANVSLRKAMPMDNGLERVADIPPYNADAITRRAESLQKTALAKQPVALFHPHTFSQLGLNQAEQIRISSEHGSAVLACAGSGQVPVGAVWVSAGRAETQGLGGLFGTLKVERV